jgi:VCBS repeat-containing protein
VSVTVVGVNDAPTIAADSTTPTGAITELAGKTNDTADKDQASGTIAFADPDLTDTHTITQAAPTFTWSGGSLTAAQQSALAAAGALTLVKADSTGTGFGSLAWTYKIPDNAFDFLAAGEKLTIIYNVTINDGHGGTVTQPITLTITGTNDAPTIVAGSTTASGSFSERACTTGDTEDQDHASGTIAFKDVDLNDTHTVSQAAPDFTWSGGTLTADQKAALTAASTLALTETDSTHSGAGSVAWTYSAADSAFDFLAAGQTLAITYNVTVTDDNGASVSQPVTVTVTGTNDAPVINGGPITASVQEDGGTASRATGQLTATDPDLTDTQTWSIVGASATHTPDYQFKIDEFKVVKTGTNAFTFDDTFSDGNPPPAVPSGSGSITSYSVTGTVSEQGYKAILTGANAGFGTGSPSGDPFFGEYATLNTNIDSSDSTHGLKDNSSFTVSGVFDLTLPAEDRNAYGIRLTDRTSSQAGDSTVELRVVRDSGGIERVQLREIDFSSHITTVLQSITLNPGSHDQILLSLAYNPANPHAAQASFELEQGGVLDGSTLTSFTSTGTIFNNENWTRAQFFAEAPEESDSVLQGTYGQLDVTQAGAWTYQLANGQANVQALAAGQTVQDTFTARVADGHGGFDTKTITVNVTGTNDNAIISVGAGNHDTGAVTENAHETGTETTSGTLSFSDVDLTDHHSVTGVTPSSGALGTLTANVTYDTTGTGTGGVLTWNYSVADSAINYLAAGQTKVETFTVSLFDGTTTVTKDVTVTITGTNDAPVVTPATAAVSEEGLPNGVPDNLPGGLDTTNSATASGTISASDVDGDALTMSLGTPTTSLTSGGVAIAWTLQDTDHTLVGKAGATTIITATITDAGAYNVTLSRPIDHPDTTQEDDKTLTIPVNVSDGHTTTPTTLSVSIEDDSPKAQPVEVSVDTNDSQTNVMLIIDVSGSMNSNAGIDDHPTWSRLDAAKAAMDDLLDQYDSHGDVRVQIVKFSTNAEQVGTDWMSVADAEEAINDLSAGGSTNYSAALTTAVSIFGDAGKLSGSGTQNVSYFLSDGEPTSGEGIGSTQQNTWESFLTTNNVISFALGISDSPTTALQPIAFDPAPGTQLADTPIIVSDLNDLADTLVFTASSASGSLLSGANSFGADGGHVQSITVDGVTYTFDPTANGGAGGITVSGDHSFTYDGTSKTLSVETSGGGELAMVMTTGAFTFQPPTDFSSETVGFVLVDGDGDTASSTLDLTATTLPAGVAGSPINLGLSDPAGHVGPVTVTIAGIPAGWTVNGGIDNGHGGWTVPTTDVSALSITSPHDYTGATALKVTMSWTNADQSIGFAKLTDNVEAFAPGAPILAWSGDDHLTGSSGPNLSVFAQPIGHDTIYSFDDFGVLQARSAGSDAADESFSDAADERHHRAQRHDRQIHRRRDHGVLERAARRSATRGQRLRGRAGNACSRGQAQSAVQARGGPEWRGIQAAARRDRVEYRTLRGRKHGVRFPLQLFGAGRHRQRCFAAGGTHEGLPHPHRDRRGNRAKRQREIRYPRDRPHPGERQDRTGNGVHAARARGTRPELEFP